MTGSILSLFTLLDWGKRGVPKLETLGTVPGLDGSPMLCKDKKGEIKIFWQYRGNLWLADIEKTSFVLSNPRESELFYPLEILNLTREDSLSEYIAFQKIHGTKLTFPLVVSVDNILQMLKGRKIIS